jgi:hypothetical protein
VAVAGQLTAYRNVFFDLQNERSINYDDRWMSQADVQDLADRVHAVDSGPIVTTSNTDAAACSGPPTCPSARPGLTVWDVGPFRSPAHLDVSTYHLARTGTWYSDTGTVVNNIWWSDMWRPVYLQEPQRFDVDPVPSKYTTAATQAKFNGAAGWTLHNKSAMNLIGGSWPISSGETTVIADINSSVWPTDWSACAFRLASPGATVSTGGEAWRRRHASVSRSGTLAICYHPCRHRAAETS